MKLNLARETLLKPLNTVIGVVGRKQSAPVLSNVLLVIEDNDLTLTGSDSEIELTGNNPFVNEQKTSASITLPGRKLMEICRSLPEDASIELYRDKEAMILRSGKSRFRLATLPADHFPKLSPQGNQLSFVMPQFELKALLQRTAFTIAQQELRHYLNGLLLEIEPDKVNAVATDGHRLSLSSAKVNTASKEKVQAIIPRKTVLELLRLLENGEESVGITLGKGQIRITADNFTLSSKLIEGKFPDYRRVIPTHNKSLIVFEKDAIKQALARAAIFCSEQNKSVRFKLSNNLLNISLNGPGHESSEEEMEIEFSEEPLDIAFNVVYLLDVLSAVSDNQIKFLFGDSNNSIILEEVNNPHNSLYVIMPVRL